ncbi:MAG: alpha/beta hydrolase family protein, partial [Aggregatilineales bacterium]
LNTIGAGYNEVLGGFLGDVISPRLAANPDYAESLDDRFKAAVLFAPWGGDLTAVGLPGTGMWNLEDMAGIDIPTLWVSGSEDDVSMYDGIVRLFDNSINSDRYLLTYDNALHNSAPNPPPPEATELGQYERYADPVWDERRINNVNQHFITAFLSKYIGGDDAASAYLNLDVENGNNAVYSVGEESEFTEDHTYWMGFPARSALGLSLRHEAVSE